MRAWSASSSIRTSPTPCSTSVCDMRHLDIAVGHDPRDRDDLVATHHERPAFAVGARDLRVDEHILDLRGPAGESVAGAPAANPKPWQGGADRPPAPPHLAVEVDGRALEPQPRVLADGVRSAAEVDPLRPDRRVEELRERGWQRPPLVERAEDVLARRRVDPLEQRDDLVPDQAADGVAIGRVDAERDPALAAERLRLLAPEAEQRADDAVLPASLDPGGRPARGEPVEDRLDLVARGMAGRTEAVGGEGVARVSQIGLGRAAAGRGPHDVGVELVGAEAGVLVR